jgi:hypothetical protein
MSLIIPITCYDLQNKERQFTLTVHNDLSVKQTVDFHFYFSIIYNGINSDYYESEYATQSYILHTDSYDLSYYVQDWIITNNKEKSINNYNGINEKLFISLFTKTYDTQTKKYILTQIAQDIRDPNYNKFQCNEIYNGNIHVSLVRGLSTGLSNQTTFDYNTVYSLSIDFNKLFGWTNPNNIISVDFATMKESQEITFPSAIINPIFKRKLLFKDINYILDNPNDYNFQFNPLGNSLELIQENNQSLIESLFISQYLNGYEKFFKVLNEEAQNQNMVLSIKKLLYNNSKLAHSSVQGVLKGIYNIFSLFCQAMGNYFVFVDEGERFRYRITTNLPKYYWVNYIKDIVHPLSWKEEYIFIDSNNDLPYINLPQTNPYNECETYLDLNNYLFDDVVGNIFDITAIGDFETENKFNFNLSNYDVTVEYDNSELIDLLDLDSNLKVDISFNNNLDDYEIDLEYLFSGIALEYKFQIYNNDLSILYQEFTSPCPKFKSIIDQTLLNGNDIVIAVTLINNNFSNRFIKNIQGSNYNTTEENNYFLTEDGHQVLQENGQYISLDFNII